MSRGNNLESPEFGHFVWQKGLESALIWMQSDKILQNGTNLDMHGSMAFAFEHAYSTALCCVVAWQPIICYYMVSGANYHVHATPSICH